MNVAVTRDVRPMPTTWQATISEGVMLRIGGLDYAAVDALVSPDVRTALDEEVRLVERCATLGDVLIQSLFEAIHDTRHDQATRKAFLAIKRDLYNSRRPAVAAMSLCIELMPVAFCRCAAEWHDTRDALDRHRRDAATMAAKLRDDGRLALQQLITERDFRLGLLTSSPSLEKALERYASAPGGPLNRKERHVEEAVVTYVCRTACKTSPFSRLTSVCFGIFGDVDNLVPPLGAQIAANVRPNISLLGRLRYFIILNLTRFPDLEVTAQDQLTSTGRRLFYRRRVETVLQNPGPIHASAKEFTFNLTKTAALGAVLDCFTHGSSRRVSHLLNVLKNGGMTAQQATHYLQLLADKGLLKPAGLQTAVLDDACWQRFRDQLRRAKDPWLLEVATAIDEVLDGAAAYAASGLEERRALIANLEARLDGLVSALVPHARAPRPVVYEDATLSPAPVVLGQAKWGAALAELPAIHRFLSLYDPLLASRLTLKAMFVQRHGRGGTCDDISAFSDHFHDRFYTAFASQRRHDGRDSFGSGGLNVQHAPDLEIVKDAREQVQEWVATASRIGAFEIEFPDALVRQIGGVVAPFQDFLSNAFYLQFTNVDGEQVVVVNRIYGGAGSSFSRFGGLFSGAEAEGPVEAVLRNNASTREGQGSVRAEFQGSYDTNLNQHALSTPLEIVFPGERAAGSKEGQIGVEELCLRHDIHTDRVRLYCSRLGEYIVPVYAGMFYPLALPELQTLLMHFSYPVQIRPDLFADSGTIEQFYPRVRYRNIVIERARWVVPADGLPPRVPGEDEFARLSKYARWNAGRRLPRRCFAQVSELGNAAAGPAQKPFYLDFESPFGLDMLEKANSNRTGVVEFTELLPSPDDAVAAVASKSRVAEFVVEITQGVEA